MFPFILSVLLLLSFSPLPTSSTVYNISQAHGLSHRFDGIGALSGGGCTSRMFVDYPEPHRSHLLDYLFLPSFGASLQILKVEIGGDAQSTEGTEPSHMHSRDELNAMRGYQWWLMKEAKRRNPHILLSALSWGFPQWVSEGTGLPFTNSTVHYIMSYLHAAQLYHNLTIDFVGIWNERDYTADYVLSLSKALRSSNLTTRLIAHDHSGPDPWDICAPLASNPTLLSAIDVLGGHYIGTAAPPVCETLGKPLWSSEDFAMTWDQGGGCWARILNQNYVRANVTATLAWNLIASYYDELAYSQDGLIHAVTPWDGHYGIGHSLYVTSHTTHFTQPGWRYLQHGQGVGLLSGGGSYVSLTDGTQLTLVIELMPSDATQCHWGTGPSYTVSSQEATFQLDASFAHVAHLYLFTTNVSSNASVDDDFEAGGTVAVVNGQVTLTLHPWMLYTLSTLNSTRGSYPTPPPATPFPLPYSDDFNAHPLDSEAPYWFDQAGSWQIFQGAEGRGRVMRQQVLAPPVPWCDENPLPYSVIGAHGWKDVNVSLAVMIEGAGIAFVGARVDGGGCVGKAGSAAVTFGVSSEGWWAVCNTTAFSSGCKEMGKVEVKAGTWYRLGLQVQGGAMKGFIDGRQVVSTPVDWLGAGWAGMGSSWSYVQFDDFSVGPLSGGQEAREEVEVSVEAEVNMRRLEME